ncbi:MAG: hypothetical protein EA402_13545 [Planctomycetota bacterium]|nr:MAG: hypothetical protein EA402_13545 [Planctomycetota bacterium]
MQRPLALLGAVMLPLALILTAMLPQRLHAATDANFAAMNFLDGQPRTVEDFTGFTVAVFAFCRV